MAQLYSQILGLSKLDVYSETGNNDNSYFDITGLPRILSYGKHPFAITFKDPENLPLLKNGSNVVFEFVDSRGTVIFSNLRFGASELIFEGSGHQRFCPSLPRCFGALWSVH